MQPVAVEKLYHCECLLSRSIHRESYLMDNKNKIHIFRIWRRCPYTGQKLYAKHYGRKAWRIPISK